jgi:hypothetical protein
MSHLAPPQIMGGRRERRGFKCATCQVFQLNHMDVLNTWRMRWTRMRTFAGLLPGELRASAVAIGAGKAKLSGSYFSIFSMQ